MLPPSPRPFRNRNPSAAKKRIKLAIATYSYWHFRDPKMSIETVMDKAAELGVEGVDILHRQMDIPEKEPLTAEHRAHLHQLKRHAFRNGLEICCVSTHQSFVKAKPGGTHGERRAHQEVRRDRLRTRLPLHPHQHRSLGHHQGFR